MAQGMRCPSCNCPRYKLIRTDRRTYHYFQQIRIVIRRRYLCEHCLRRWWSNELPESDVEHFLEGEFNKTDEKPPS